MKKMIFLLIFAAATACCFSQNIGTTSPVIQKNYLQKSKNQKTAAWVVLGTGAVINIIGLATFPKDYNAIDIFGQNSPSSERQANTSSALFYVGTTVMLTSIPFFIIGHINKKKAVQVAVNTQQLRQLRSNSLYSINYPALTMKIRF